MRVHTTAEGVDPRRDESDESDVSDVYGAPNIAEVYARVTALEARLATLEDILDVHGDDADE